MHAHETIYNLQLDNLRTKRVVAKYYLEPISQHVFSFNKFCSKLNLLMQRPGASKWRDGITVVVSSRILPRPKLHCLAVLGEEEVVGIRKRHDSTREVAFDMKGNW